MLKLIKWAFYGLMGYALYELYLGVMKQGMGQGGGGGMMGGGQGSSSGQDFENAGRGRMTGGGEGTRQRSEEGSSGMAVPHNVGRGVIR